MKFKKAIILFTSFAFVLSAAGLQTASADSKSGQRPEMKERKEERLKAEVVKGKLLINDKIQPAFPGKISAINGTTITLEVRKAIPNPEMMRGSSTRATSTTTRGSSTKPVIQTLLFTVDASTAVIRKNNATTTVSSLIVGDMIVVKGTVDTNAKTIKASVINANAQNMLDKKESHDGKDDSKKDDDKKIRPIRNFFHRIFGF